MGWAAKDGGVSSRGVDEYERQAILRELLAVLTQMMRDAARDMERVKLERWRRSMAERERRSD